MKDIAFVFLPFGVILSILLLSGVAVFQRIAISFQKKSIRFQLYSKSVNISASSIILIYTLIRFFGTIIELNHYKKEKINFDNLSVVNFNRTYLKKMRLQRNFWILLLCSITWFFLIRFSYLLIYYREKVREIDEMHEKKLSDKKKRESFQKETEIKKEKKAKKEKTLEEKEEEEEEEEKEDEEEEKKEEEEEEKKEVVTKKKTSILTDDNTKQSTLRQRF